MEIITRTRYYFKDKKGRENKIDDIKHLIFSDDCIGIPCKTTEGEWYIVVLDHFCANPINAKAINITKLNPNVVTDVVRLNSI